MSKTRDGDYMDTTDAIGELPLYNPDTYAQALGAGRVRSRCSTRRTGESAMTALRPFTHHAVERVIDGLLRSDGSRKITSPRLPWAFSSRQRKPP